MRRADEEAAGAPLLAPPSAPGGGTDAGADATWPRVTWPKSASEWAREAGGALGDIGTFLPLVLAMTLVNGLDLGTTLVLTGLYNALQGVLFGLPMPVQPMKAIAAVAISSDPAIGVPVIMAGGLLMSLALLLLSVTGAIHWISALVPLPVVRGVQLGLGLQLAIKGASLVWFMPAAPKGPHLSSLHTPQASSPFPLSPLSTLPFSMGGTQSVLLAPTPRPWVGAGKDSLALALGAAALVLLVSGAGPRRTPPSSSSPSAGPVHSSFQEGPQDRTPSSANGASSRSAAVTVTSAGAGAGGGPWGLWRAVLSVPPSLLLVLLGLLLGVASAPEVVGSLRLGPSVPRLTRPSWGDLRHAAWSLALPQLPLTVLNSVVAVCQLSADLFPARRLQPQRLSLWIALINGCGCMLGAMPVCTGAGGLAGQHRFGGSSGVAVLLLGAGGALVGLLFGGSLLPLLSVFPSSFLGTLLLFSGLELAASARDQVSKEGAFLCHFTAFALLASKDTFVGVVVGLAVAALLFLHDWIYRAART